ncbi:MAG: DUF4962 domain-containing protein, partial [Candidatus Latescibacterota bacterium]
MKSLKLFLFLFLCAPASILPAQPKNWDFDQENAGWRAEAKTAAISTEKGVSARSGGKACLRVQSTGSTERVLASSGSFLLSTKQFFRLTARVRVDRSAPQNAGPVLKCEFCLTSPGTLLGESALTGYDFSRPGSWQQLSVEFRVPYGTERGRLVIGYPTGKAKKTDQTNAVDMYVDDIRLERLDHYTVEGRYLLKPFPASLEKVRSVHPRIFLNERRIRELRESIKTTHATIWKDILAQTDEIAARKPQPYLTEWEYSNIEQNWQRRVGDNMPFLALAWLLTGERKYLDAAEQWALASCGYPTWGLYDYDGRDLATGHQLFGLGIVYDWCYSDLTEKTRRTIREALLRRGSSFFQAAAEGNLLKSAEAYVHKPWVEWDEAYIQNHLWDNSCGLAVAGFALFDEVDNASQWIAFTLEKHRITMSLLGEDGASHEGPGYWTYGIEYMLKFMDLSRDLLDVDMYDNTWWRNTARYRLYMSLPQNSWTSYNTTVNYGDGPRSDYYGPDYQLRRLAGEFRDGHAQWLAESLAAAKAVHPIDQWLNLIWYDPGVAPAPPGDLPTLHHFTDMEFVSARSGWSGDESMLFFKCGPWCGHKAIHEMNYCPSSAHHVHPDAGNFMLFGGGDWLIRDDGYFAKYTGYHNTLLIDGGEQFGGGFPIFDAVKAHALKSEPRILDTLSTPELNIIVGDVTPAYPHEAGLKRFVRRLLFLKPDILIVADDIDLDRHRALELRFHPEQQKGTRDGS